MKNSIRHTGIVVQNLNQVRNFWIKIMGFKIEKEIEDSGSYIDNIVGLKNTHVKTVKLKDHKGNMIELLKFNSHPDHYEWLGSPSSTGLTHIALNVDDIERIIESMNSEGYINKKKFQLSPDGRVKVIYVRGPEGLILELVETL